MPSNSAADERVFDLEAFQRQVLRKVETLQLMVKIRADRKEAQARLDTLRVRDLKSLSEFVLEKFATLQRLEDFKRAERIDELTAQAGSFLRGSAARELLCPSLLLAEESLSRLSVRTRQGDASEIAARITPLLSAEARAGKVALALDPMLFALCAWMLARTGAATYCSGAGGQTNANPNNQ